MKNIIPAVLVLLILLLSGCAKTELVEPMGSADQLKSNVLKGDIEGATKDDAEGIFDGTTLGDDTDGNQDDGDITDDNDDGDDDGGITDDNDDEDDDGEITDDNDDEKDDKSGPDQVNGMSSPGLNNGPAHSFKY